MFGDYGADRVSGGEGDDDIGDGVVRDGDRDVLRGSPGNDRIGANNTPPEPDTVACGPGRDQTWVDSEGGRRMPPS
jgi:hypothetical protein